ncbi:hypothetical protein [uncultured Mediterranean phage]|jgi:hypothetical protein|nr:hypothetical protein [uncultured Mediterranean phage]
MALTYSTLVQAIKDYTDNTETVFVSQIDQFISNAEQRILFEVQLPVFRKNTQGTLTSANKYLALPNDFLAPFSLSVVSSNTYYFLLNKDVNFLQESYPDTTETGRPLYYSIFDDTNLLVAPVPDADYTMEFHYVYKPDGLSSSNTTTWLGTNAYDALLYASLIEAYIFMKGDAELLTYYQTRYQETLPRVKNLGEGRDRKDVFRSGQLRIAVT